jgi:hypothetical protein
MHDNIAVMDLGVHGHKDHTMLAVIIDYPPQVPEAPTYYPTEEQFKDPFAYIASIREEAQKFGIARIVPPASWNPPFALEKGTDGRIPDSFRFTTRKQFTSHLCMRAPRSFGQQGGSSGGAPEDGQEGGCEEPVSSLEMALSAVACVCVPGH